MAIAKNVLVLIVDDTPDSQGHTFDPAGIELPPVEVPVTYNFGRDITDWLGYATLKKGEDGNIYADIDFRGPNTQVDLLARLTPAIGCVAFELSTVFERTIIDRCRITSIGCSGSRNADPRIPTLGDQGVFGPRNPCAEVVLPDGPCPKSTECQRGIHAGACRRANGSFFVPEPPVDGDLGDLK